MKDSFCNHCENNNSCQLGISGCSTFKRSIRKIKNLNEMDKIKSVLNSRIAHLNFKEMLPVGVEVEL